MGAPSTKLELPAIPMGELLAVAEAMRSITGIELKRAELFLRLESPILTRDQTNALLGQIRILKQAEDLVTKRMAELEADRLEEAIASNDRRDAHRRGSALRSDMAIAPTPARRTDPIQ